MFKLGQFQENFLTRKHIALYTNWNIKIVGRFASTLKVDFIKPLH